MWCNKAKWKYFAQIELALTVSYVHVPLIILIDRSFATPLNFDVHDFVSYDCKELFNIALLPAIVEGIWPN